MDDILINSPSTHDLKVATVLSSETQCKELCFYLLDTHTHTHTQSSSSQSSELHCASMISNTLLSN